MRVFLLLSVSLIIFSCKKKESLDQLKWMEGVWLKDDPDTLLYSSETWETISDFEMKGIGLTAEADDTVFFENLKIVSEKDGIFYVADVGNGPVYFKLTSSETNKWVFENPEHDFPQRIVYTRTDTSMVAYAEAADVSIPFRFKKSNQ